MGRYRGTLHRLCDAGPAKKGNWNHLLTYLELHSRTNPDAKNPRFDSPLPAFTSASNDLYEELMDPQGPRGDETPLRIVTRFAGDGAGVPSHVVAALCHLCPDAARVADSRERLPLHWACRRATVDRDTERVLRILIATHAEGLIHRDDGGRTPLHYLFWYHAHTRTTRLVEIFLQPLPRAAFLQLQQKHQQQQQQQQHAGTNRQRPLPDIPSPNTTTQDTNEKVPSHAAIVPDARHGCLPLHYAVMEGASKEVIKQLLLAYPQSKMIGDRVGRTALTWYLGGGALIDRPVHVCGESPDPNAVPWWNNKLSANIIHLLLNSMSARKKDESGRCALHWACHLLAKQHYHNTNSKSPLSLKVVQLLLDNHIEALTIQDHEGFTPLHVLFSTISKLQALEWIRISHNKAIRDDLDLVRGGFLGKAVEGFSPPLELMELLLRHPDTDASVLPVHVGDRPKCAAHVEDPQGRLPLHLAVWTASSPKIVQLLIQTHPTSLVHTTEEDLSQTPLHMALASPYATPLQVSQTINVLLQAYVTSRHGTFVNGRLALKMEDANGMFPIHLACQNQACWEVIKLLYDKYPRSGRFTNGVGDLPLHTLLDQENFFGMTEMMSSTKLMIGASLATPMGWTSDSEDMIRLEYLSVYQKKFRLLIEAIMTDPESLRVASHAHGMLPLHVAIAFDAVPYSTLYTMLDRYPEAATTFTTAVDHSYSALDLHEMRRSALDRGDAEGEQKWHMVRELLFAYGPLLEPHRHTDELLEQCARVVREEVVMADHVPLYHVDALEEWLIRQKETQAGQHLEIQETMSSIKPPEIDRGCKPQYNKTARTPKNLKAHQQYLMVELESPKSANKDKKSTKSKSRNVANTCESLSPSRKKHHQKRKTPKDKTGKKSIYDDDDGHGYQISPEASYDDDDEDYFSDEVSKDEEYDPDEHDSRFDKFDEETRTYFGDDETRTYDDSRTYDSRTYDSRTYDDARTYASRTVDDASTYQDEVELILEESPSKNSRHTEEKKEEEEVKAFPVPRLSEVAMRIWTCFALYHNKKDPRDHYAKQVEYIIEELPYQRVMELINLTLPKYADSYLVTENDLESASSGRSKSKDDSEEEPLETRTFKDNAYNPCRAVIQKVFYFAGRYEFRSGQDTLMHRTNIGDTAIVRAIEYIVETEKVTEHVIELGTTEAAIWETGEVPAPKPDTIESIFRISSRPVCFKFMRSQEAYDREVRCRKELGINLNGLTDKKSMVVPLAGHYHGVLSSRREDRRYYLDSNDERFHTLDLGDAGTMLLTDYPFALAMPYREGGDLFDHFLHHGSFMKHEIRQIGLEVGLAVQTLHQKSLIHGNLCMPKFTQMEGPEDSDIGMYWALNDLTSTCKQGTDGVFMAGVSSSGAVNFSTSTFPPELFVKLSPSDLKTYNTYWETVKTVYKADVDEEVITPHVDPTTGDSYVVRCHYHIDESTKPEKAIALPELPYKLVPARQTADIWAFGLLLFTICSSGHPLFPTNLKTGHLLAYHEVATWSHETARFLVYKHVDDPLAQDILLHILSTYEERSALKMDTVLYHPYFSQLTSQHDPTKDQITQQIVDLRSKERIAFKRQFQQDTVTQIAGEWVSHRSKQLILWDMNLLIRMYLAPSNLLREIFSNGAKPPEIPFGALLLPYKLARSKSGKLTPATKKDVERAERTGIKLLALSKSCFFVNLIEAAVASNSNTTKWTLSDLSTAMALPGEDYQELEEEIAKAAAKEVETFRDNPVAVGKRLIQERIKELSRCFEESKAAYLYLVDEYECIPVVDPKSVYPFEIKENLPHVFQHTLPLMHTCALFARGAAGSTSGLVKLIFEAAYPHIPPSWNGSAKGLSHRLDKESMAGEIRVLHDACTELFGGVKGSTGMDDLGFLQTYLELCDKKKSYSELKRITNGEAAFWTTDAGVERIESLAGAKPFMDAYDMESRKEQKLKQQAERIKELEAKLESLEFRLRHNLVLPE